MNAVTKPEPAENMMPADPYISMIERVAMDPGSDLTKLERMMELKERHDAANAKAEFAAAFARASADFPTIPLRGKGHNNKPYATLEDITRLTRPVLSEYGLALTFAVEVGQDVVVTAKLMHKAGHSEQTSMALPRDTSGSKNAVQAVGSTQKYGQRYTAQAILGLSLGDDDEDDGAAASGKTNTVTAEQFVVLRDLIAETGTDEVKFHRAYGHSDPENADLRMFPANRFEAAKAQLERKKAGS
jgi:hypothetical protein